MSWQDATGQMITMRASDHQILMPYYLGTFSKGMKYDSEKTGLGWRIDVSVKPADIAQPTTCKMVRPQS